MQATVKTKRKYYTKSQKRKILSELESGDMTHSELARRHGIHPITIYAWKRTMRNDKPTNQPAYDELLDENSGLKEEISNLKKALGEMAVDNQILKTANDVLKKMEREEKLKSSKKLSRK